MSLPQPSKLCAKKDYFKNISISQEICDERLSKVDLLRANCLNSAYDDKFEHLLNKDSDFDIDCSRLLMSSTCNPVTLKVSPLIIALKIHLQFWP